jgi:autotransporter-associated beta strand protein
VNIASLLRFAAATVLGGIVLAWSSPGYPNAVWTGGGTSRAFSNAANWNGDILPSWTGTATLEFGTGGTSALDDIAGTASVAGMVFDCNGNFLVSTGTGSLLLVGTGGIVCNAPNNSAWDYALIGSTRLGAAQTWRQMGEQATLDLEGSVDTNGNVLTLQADGGQINVAAAVSGSGSLVVQGLAQQSAGVVTLSGSNSLTGSTTIFGPVTLNLDYGTVTASKLAAAAPLAIQQNGTLFLAGNATAAATQTTGSLTIGKGASTITYINNGQSLVLAPASLQRQSYGVLNVNSSYLDQPGGDGLTFTTAPTLSGTGTGVSRGIVPYAYAQQTDPNTGAIEYDLLTVDGQSLRRLTADEQTTTVQSGANVRLGASASLSASTSVNSLMLAGSTGDPLTLDGPAGSVLTVAGGAVVCGGPFTSDTIAVPQLTFGPNNATGYEGILTSMNLLNVQGQIVDNGAHAVDLTVNGYVYLQNQNTYSGATRIVFGTLTAAADDPLPHGTAVTVETGAALSLFDDQTGVSYSATIGSLDGNGLVNLGAGTLTVDTTNPSPAPFTGQIFGDGSLVKAGSGTLILAGTNTYGGETEVDGGTLEAACPAALPQGTAFDIAAGGTLALLGGNLLPRSIFSSAMPASATDDSMAPPPSLGGVAPVPEPGELALLLAAMAGLAVSKAIRKVPSPSGRGGLDCEAASGQWHPPQGVCRFNRNTDQGIRTCDDSARVTPETVNRQSRDRSHCQIFP